MAAITSHNITKAINFYFGDSQIPLADKLEYARLLKEDAEKRSKDLTKLVAYDIANTHIAPVMERLLWEKQNLLDSKVVLIGSIRENDERSKISFNLVMRSYQMLILGEKQGSGDSSFLIRFSPGVSAMYNPSKETLNIICDGEDECDVIRKRFNISCHDPNDLDYTCLDFTKGPK